MDFSELNSKDLLTVSFTLFAIIDIIGAVPVLMSHACFRSFNDIVFIFRKTIS
jgi:hypothetical protein